MEANTTKQKAFTVIRINTAISSRRGVILLDRRGCVKLLKLEHEKGIVVRFMIGHRLSSCGNSHARMITSQDSGDRSSRFVGSVQLNGLEIYLPQRREQMLDVTARQHNLHYLIYILESVGFSFSVKLYPAGATTNSQDGVTDLFGKCAPVLGEMKNKTCL